MLQSADSKLRRRADIDRLAGQGTLPLDPLLHKLIPFAIPLGAVAIFGVVWLLDYVYFAVLPPFAHRRYRATHPERLRRFLEWVVATPSLAYTTRKLFARESLAGIYLGRGEHAEAVAQFQANLKCLSELGESKELFRTLEANYRVRLANSLEALGRVDEAAEERRRAKEWIDQAPLDELRHRTRATLLREQDRYEEEYAEYQKELDLIAASKTLERIQCMVRLTLAATQAGRPAESLRWAEAAIALGAKHTHLRIAHRMAGQACTNLGRLEEAERHYRRAYDVAAALNNQPAMAGTLANLASCLCKLGKLAEAGEVCARATAMDPKGGRLGTATQAVIFVLWGRYDDALAAMERFREAAPRFKPRGERRIDAVCSLDCARIEAGCGRPDDAWRHIQEALAELRDDAKLGFQCQAALSRVHAARGDADESQRLAASLEPDLTAFERDPGTCRSVLYDLGMAACARGDYPAGTDCWTRYLALRPHPVYRPDALYHRGECHRHLGRIDEARADYQAAVNMDIASHFSRLALQRLGELALS
jgi:tetratricopeptide (TPR) repeat protein